MKRVTVPDEPGGAGQDGGQEDAGDAGNLTSSKLQRGVLMRSFLQG